jgi:hypothetical protein
MGDRGVHNFKCVRWTGSKRVGAPEKVSADALRAPLGPTLQAPRPLVGKAGDQYLIRQLRHLLRRSSRTRDELARSQTAGFRLNGRRLAIPTDTSELACRT